MKPPGAVRVVWILARTGLRRFANRLSSQARWKKRSPGAPEPPRQATPRKRRGGGVLLAFLGLMFCWTSLFQSMGFLGKLSSRIVSLDPQLGIHLVEGSDYRAILNAEAELARDATEVRREAVLQSLHARFLQELPDGQAGSAEDREARARTMLESFRRKGSDAFLPTGPGAFLVGGLWPDPPADAAMVRCLGLLLAIIAASLLFSGLGMANQDLGSISSSLEWLFTMPVPARVIFLAKALEHTLLSITGWVILLPLLSVTLWVEGLGPAAIPLALGATLAFLAVVGSLRVVLETWLRKRFSPGRLKSFQAGFTLLGMGLLAVIFWIALSPTVPEVFVRMGRALPAAALGNPFALPVLIGEGGTISWVAAGTLTSCVIVLLAGCSWISGRLVADGIVDATGAYQGRRLAGPSPSRERMGWIPRGILGKDLRLVLRDRNVLVQALVLPLFILVLQVVINPALLSTAAGDFRHAAALAFGVGAYLHLSTSFGVLTMEGGALWILYALPRPLHTILLVKTAFWGGIAALYALVIIIVSAVNGSPPGAAGLGLAALALAGVVIHGFIASGLGVLATDPLETEPARRLNPVTVYLYFLVASLFANAIYQPAVWPRLAQLVLTAVLAAALWQKVRDRLPYLLDPTEAPPPRIALADGLIAALAFFAIQGLLTLLFLQGGEPMGASIFYSFAIAGVVCGLFSLYVFARMKVPDLRSAVGLVLPPGSVARSLGWGVPLGAASAALGLGYLELADRIPALRELAEEAMRLRESFDARTAAWIAILAVLLAPPFEEFIFRGLVFRGIRRSTGPAAAILLSAAIFAIVHPPIAMAPVFGLGIAAALALERSGSLLGPVIVHAIYNLAMVARA